ncbi:MAG: alpha/beta fold hydrolase [Actinomycetota bacterium]
MADFVTPTEFLPGDRDAGRPELPVGYELELPGRGTTFVRTVQGPPDAPTVLLLHGWTVTAALNWFRVYRPLSERFTVVSFDQRGHGRGIRPTGRFRLRDAVDDAVALLNELEIDHTVVAGYSMGGTVTQLLARHYRDRVAGIVLAATWAHGPSTALQNRALKGSHIAGSALQRISGPRQTAAIRGVWGRVAPTSPSQRPPWFVDEVLSGSMPHIVGAGRELARFDSRRWISTLDLPAGVFVTTRDNVVPPGRQHALAARLPHAEVRDAPIDHDGCVVRPDAFVDPFVELVDLVAP